MSAKCVVCNLDQRNGLLMCRRCRRSYDRMVKTNCDVASVLVWAAKRARRFAKGGRNV